MDKGLTKLAHAAIKQLQAEKEELSAQLMQTDEAIKLAFELYNNGQLAAEQLESKIKEYSNKPAAEIQIIKKASELTKVASNLSSFRLSDSGNFDRSTPEDRFNAFLVGDL